VSDNFEPGEPAARYAAETVEAHSGAAAQVAATEEARLEAAAVCVAPDNVSA